MPVHNAVHVTVTVAETSKKHPKKCFFKVVSHLI
jgi:hypothetical protein